MRALVVRGGALGDLILTLPVVDALREAGHEVDVVANGAFRPLLRNCVGVAASHTLDSAELAPFFAASATTSKELQSWFREFDVVISYLHDADGAFEENIGAKNFVRGAYAIGGSAHATDQLLEPLTELQIQVRSREPRLRVAAATREYRVTIHPGSGSAKKNWPIENWIAVGDWLLHCAVPFAVVAGEADVAQRDALKTRWENRATFLDNLPLEQLAAAVGETIVVGHDSGISHVAAATRARCLLLFGPTEPAVWAPRGDVRVLRDASVAEVTQELMRMGIRT